jgi:hypothetical protein
MIDWRFYPQTTRRDIEEDYTNNEVVGEMID